HELASKYSMALGVQLAITYDAATNKFARRHANQNFQVRIPAHVTSVTLDVPNVTTYVHPKSLHTHPVPRGMGHRLHRVLNTY
ncbi:MAG: hypothetical protein SGPRY_013784, partial [Prymnesium sp.]